MPVIGHSTQPNSSATSATKAQLEVKISFNIPSILESLQILSSSTRSEVLTK